MCCCGLQRLDSYLELMTDLGVLLGGERNETTRLMRDVIDFEVELAKLTLPPADRRDEEKLYHKMSLRDVQDLAPVVSHQNTLFSDGV